MNYEDPNYNVGLPVFMIHGAWSPKPGVSAFRSEIRLRRLLRGGANNRSRDPRTATRAFANLALHPFRPQSRLTP